MVAQWIVILNLITAGQGLVLALGLYRARPTTRPDAVYFLIAILLGAAVSLTMFTAFNQRWMLESMLMDILYTLIVLTVPSSCYGLFTASVRVRSPLLVLYAPVIGYVLIALLSPRLAVALGQIDLLVGYFMLVVAAAIIRVGYQRHTTQIKVPRHIWGFLGILFVFFALHIVRYAYDNSTVAFDLLPVMGAVGIWVFMFYVISTTSVLRRLTASAMPNAQVDQVRLSKRFEELLKDPDFLSRGSLSRTDIAAALGVRGGELSQMVAQVYADDFRNVVNRFRVHAAANLLKNADYATASIESIGMTVGFKSRSSFYNAFEQVFGKSPGAYRDT